MGASIEEQIQDVISRYKDSVQLRVSDTYTDGGLPGGLEFLFLRLERAALNQACDGDATFSRYAIWANTLRDTIIFSIQELGEDAVNREAIKSLVQVANALSAFSDIQGIFDQRQTDASQDD
ncbi:hypothetical protein M1B72_08920 [Geomonas paludis]|uniref:Uncharacterized protein n=1 Tax=Geomonas paludis TaxID=2740185 RepID=A0ABY4LKY9_9BACT|nr:hypothetical protein [Geomonas paludis]UPU37811.1 hypothetical protein M1B72_08920 [Geomonas paludis]